MSMYNDIVWRERGNTEKCIMNSVTVANSARRFLLGRCSFWGPGSEKKFRVRGGVLGNTKIGPVLDVKVCLHQKRYGIEIMVEDLFRDSTVSWVRIVNGINKYVTESSETISLESFKHRVTGKPFVKARHCLLFLILVVKEMHRHQSKEIPSRLFYCVESHDQITAT